MSALIAQSRAAAGWSADAAELGALYSRRAARAEAAWCIEGRVPATEASAFSGRGGPPQLRVVPLVAEDAAPCSTVFFSCPAAGWWGSLANALKRLAQLLFRRRGARQQQRP